MKKMNQFEFLGRINKAIAMYAFSNNIVISEVTVNFKAVTVKGYRDSEQCKLTMEFTSLEHLEKAAYGF